MKLTRIGLALAVTMAFVAIASTSAFGALEQFRSEGNKTVNLFGKQETTNHVFKVDGQAVECGIAEFKKASQTSPSTQIVGVSATYKECEAFGFVGAEVDMGSCLYTFLQPNSKVGNVKVECPTVAGKNKYIKIRASFLGSTCEARVEQTATNENLSKVSYENLTAPNPDEVKVSAEVTGIEVNKITDSGLCPLSGTGKVTNGTYTGPTNVHDEAKATGVSVS